MNKKLILSLSAAALLCNNLDAQTMLERFEAMENEMNALKQEIAELKSPQQNTLANAKDSDEQVDLDLDEDADDEEDEDSEEIDIAEELEEIHENLSDLNKATAGSHLKFGIDYRFAADNLQYEMADGSKLKNDALLTNRLWINTGWAATKNLSFTGQLAYNKAFGARSTSLPAGMESFDWIANENAYDDSLRVRSAYFFYKDSQFLGTDVPWTFSIGRRPSTNGHLINFRDDDKAASPLAHAINVEFDGLSSKFSFDKWVDGMYVKFCAGRGMSNAAPKFSSEGAPYAEDDAANTSIDLAGLIFSPYSDGQYSVTTQYYYANNLIDMNPNPALGFDTVGGMHSATANFTMNGIGNEWNDFLDDSIFFVSVAMSKTNPDAGQGMLGSNIDESVTGTSYWIGAQFPSLISEYGRMGFEFNHGSKHWRSITYGEDTNAGSKVATRGNAYEAYFTEYLVDEILSLQVRYTYIDYDYAGSNGFFGNTSGAATEISSTMPFASSNVDKAQNIRFYLRYKY